MNKDIDTEVKSIPHSILMVCLGNICRSPLAEEVMRIKSQEYGFKINVDSCGTGSWHAGEQADKRSRKIAQENGYNIEQHRARQITENDFYDFDILIAMDKNNLADINAMKNHLIHQGVDTNILADTYLFSTHDKDFYGQKVPDPYYGDMSDFKDALIKVESMTLSWLTFWQNNS